MKSKYRSGIRILVVLPLVVLGLWQCGDPGDIAGGRVVALKHSWERAIPNQKVPKGLGSLSAKECGTCHVQHYAEWKTSTHAYAWKDNQYQEELRKESSPYLCNNCHVPLQNQQKYMVSGLLDGDIYKPVKKVNPDFDPELREEGITCASCHVRNNKIVGPTGKGKAPHKMYKDPDFLSESLCLSCHNANAVVTPELACTFQTGDEWKEGPFYGKKNCIDCHMPETVREVVPGTKSRKSRYHFFPGSGIPKVEGQGLQALNGLKINFEVSQRQYREGDSLDLHLSLTNEFAGHRLPTGDPERFYTITMELTGPEGQVVDTINYRIGEKWEWYPVAKKISDNNLDPGETRDFRWQPLLSGSGKYKVTVRVTKHRMSVETALYSHLGTNYPLQITVFEEESAIVVP